MVVWCALVLQLAPGRADCVGLCETYVAAGATAESACHAYKSSRKGASGLRYQSCEQGYAVGSSIGCLHRCNHASELSAWTLDAGPVNDAVVGACDMKSGSNAAFKACVAGYSKGVEIAFQTEIEDVAVAVRSCAHS